MKNLAFGSITNTARLHGQMWNDTCASVVLSLLYEIR